jgi:KEOPS complex subunit Pcc1
MPAPAPPADGGDADHTITVAFEYATERRARTVADSVRVETDEVPDDRSRAQVDRDGRAVGVDISAADLVALRAGANTWLRFVGVAEDVAGAVDGRRLGAGNGSPHSDDG